MTYRHNGATHKQPVWPWVLLILFEVAFLLAFMFHPDWFIK